jgi:hypothetical protein
MTPKEEQRELIIEIMKADEKSGIYDEPNRKLTAVEWMFNQLWNTPKDKFVWNSILNAAKQSEKNQIFESLIDGRSMGLGFSDKLTMEEYYKQTYGKDA